MKLSPGYSVFICTYISSRFSSMPLFSLAKVFTIEFTFFKLTRHNALDVMNHFHIARIYLPDLSEPQVLDFLIFFIYSTGISSISLFICEYSTTAAKSLKAEIPINVNR